MRRPDAAQAGQVGTVDRGLLPEGRPIPATGDKAFTLKIGVTSMSEGAEPAKLLLLSGHGNGGTVGALRTRTALLIAGSLFIGLALLFLAAVSTMYWPLQSVVQVMAPFLAVSILASVGLSLFITALLVPQSTGSGSETTSVIESLLSETNRRR